MPGASPPEVRTPILLTAIGKPPERIFVAYILSTGVVLVKGNLKKSLFM
jgi:hypothetical protein